MQGVLARLRGFLGDWRPRRLAVAPAVLCLLAAAAQAEVWTCSGSSSCGGCTASGNVSVTCSSSAKQASCTSVNQEGGVTTTTVVKISCRHENLGD